MSANPAVDVFATKFSTLTYEEQLAVLENGKPTPDLPKLLTLHVQKGKQYWRKFSTDNYRNVEWLCGNETLNRLFCWPCVLFSDSNTIWNEGGFVDLTHLSKAVKGHEKGQVHIQAYLDWKMMLTHTQDPLEISHLQKNEKNKQIKSNLVVLRRVLDVILFWIKEDTLPKARTPNCFPYLEMLSKSDPGLMEHLPKNQLLRSCPNLERQLVFSVKDVLKNHLKVELSSTSSFVSATFESHFEKLWTVLRFVKDGHVLERLVDVKELELGPDGVFENFVNLVRFFGIENRLSAQCYGALKLSGAKLRELKVKLLNRYPFQFMSHSGRHDVSKIFLESLSSIEECGEFFKYVEVLKKHFENRREFERLPGDGWDFSDQEIWHTVKTKREELKIFFENRLESHSLLDASEIMKSRELARFLDLQKTCWLLWLVDSIMECVVHFETDSENYLCDTISMGESARTLLHSLTTKREMGASFYCKFYSSNKKTKLEEHPYLKELFEKIFDDVYTQIRIRYTPVETFDYFAILNHRKFNDYRQSFPVKLTGLIHKHYGPVFEDVFLVHSLRCCVARQEFHGKNPEELLRFLSDYKLKEGFSELYSLCQLVLSIPCNNNVVEEARSCFSRLPGSEITAEKGLQEALLHLRAEKVLVEELEEQEGFFESVLDAFLKIDPEMANLLKNV